MWRFAVMLMAATRVWAQTPGKLPEFEVASIKPNKTNEKVSRSLLKRNWKTDLQIRQQLHS